MSEMKFRLAKSSDAGRIAEIQQKVKEVNSLGIFCKMGHRFLKTYYSILIDDSTTVFICAENEHGIICGYTFNVLDAEKQNNNLKKHKFRLVFSAITSVLRNPRLIKELHRRYKSVKCNDDCYLHSSGAHGGYWGWDPDIPDADSSLLLHEIGMKIINLLGTKTLHFEVDTENKNVFKFHKINGAKVEKMFTLPDGRERAFMYYDLNNHKYKL